MDALVVHQGDDRPTLRFRIKDQDAGEYVDLSASTTTITAKFREKGTTTVLQTITCTKLFGGKHGHVEMVWPATALDDDAGKYEIEVAVSFNGEIQTCNKYYWSGESCDYSATFPVKLKEDF